MAARKKRTEDLIRMIQRYPIMYDAGHPDFKNNSLKDEIFDEIGSVLGEDGEEIRRKWKNLRDTYARSIKGQYSKPGQSKWKWMDHMEFMRPHFGTSSSSVTNDNVDSVSGDEMVKSEPLVMSCESNKSEPFEMSCESNKSETFVMSCESNKSEPFVMSCESNTPPSPELSIKTEIYPTSSTKDKARSSQHNGLKKKRKVSFDSDTSVSSEEIKSDLDRVDYFFLGYAEFFKKLSTRGQIMIKLKMAQMFTEEELKELNY
ncbi:transcription factor Adf-1-like [Physella acuta]|uniref:transcription factor Adf-1-like n=1 Tax=Physella acuta TaxID=109671 RepID=UPI0027DD9B25|nr:transcription factor Adf-1-like [Physella acuta]